jgi:hypothetical protein
LPDPAFPPLYLHITSQTKEGLEKAVAKIEELMKQDLPNLIDERRFRRPEREERQQVERDELGRVCGEGLLLRLLLTSILSANGPKSTFPSTLSLSMDSIFVLASLVKAVKMSSTSSRRLAVESRSRVVVPVSWSKPLVSKAMSQCI